MLVNKKQDWDIYQQQELPSIKKKYSVKPDIALRVKCLTTAIIVVFVAMFLTACSEAIIRSGYELVQMKLQVIKLEKENELLKLDIAKLRSPQRIQNIATAELGMVMPQSVYYADGVSKNTELNTEKEKSIVSMVLNSKGQ
jgi:cell division protein FtsL